MRRRLIENAGSYSVLGHQPSLGLRLIAFFLVLWLVLICGGASQVVSRDAVVDRSWLSDLQGTLSPEQALSSQWTKYEGALARGFTSSVTWVRLKLEPALGWVRQLSIRPPFGAANHSLTAR